MLHISTLVAGFLASGAISAPLSKRDVPPPAGGDATIFNYALTLEYFKHNFYQEGLRNFTEADFIATGFTQDFHENLVAIYQDEQHQTHVEVISSTLGSAAVAEPSSFPVTDVHSFIGLAAVLEGVGVSAYLGALPEIANKTYVTAAGTITSVEARHVAYIRANLGQVPSPNAFDTPLDFNQTFSFAAQFITSTPNGTALPFRAFPSLAAAMTPNGYLANTTVIDFTETVNAATSSSSVSNGTTVYAVFYSGLQTYYVCKTRTFVATVPGPDYTSKGQPAPSGQTYVILSTADGKNATASDENTVAGVGIIEVTG